MESAARKIQRAYRTRLLRKKNATNKIRNVYRKYHAPSKQSLKNVTEWNPVTRQILNSRPLGAYSGTRSAFGSVRNVGSNKKYVMKEMVLRTPNELKIFRNEIRVGLTPGIQRVGPKIYGWEMEYDNTGEPRVGRYVMDNVLRGEQGRVLMTLADYVRNHPNLPPTDPLFRKLRTTLQNFWILTKGYHGDLHANNIAVVTEDDNTTVVRVMIYDYGAHKRFKTRFNKRMSFINLTKVVNQNFARSIAKRPSRQGSMHGVRTYAPIVGQVRRSNVNMLRPYHAALMGVAPVPVSSVKVPIAQRLAALIRSSGNQSSKFS